MNKILLCVFVVLISSTTFGQTAAKTVQAVEIVNKIAAGQAVDYENVVINGDLDLSNLQARSNDAVYKEKDKTARVFTANIKQPITFRNVVFNGQVNFFRKETTDREINEFRLAFSSPVKFENCTFEKQANLELTNFDAEVSFQNSSFKQSPLFIRIGLVKLTNLENVVFENGAIFKNFQNDQPQNLSAVQLSEFYQRYLDSNK